MHTTRGASEFALSSVGVHVEVTHGKDASCRSPSSPVGGGTASLIPNKHQRRRVVYVVMGAVYARPEVEEIFCNLDWILVTAQDGEFISLFYLRVVLFLSSLASPAGRTRSGFSDVFCLFSRRRPRRKSPGRRSRRRWALVRRMRWAKLRWGRLGGWC